MVIDIFKMDNRPKYNEDQPRQDNGSYPEWSTIEERCYDSNPFMLVPYRNTLKFEPISNGH